MQPAPSFHEAVNMAWAIDPVRTELQVGHHSARARASAAGSWFAGGPTLSGEYMDDHMLGSNEGYTTYQGGVSVPLWLPGQGSATRQVATAEADSLDEQINVEHMALSIRVLDATAAALIASTRVAVARALYEAVARMGPAPPMRYTGRTGRDRRADGAGGGGKRPQRTGPGAGGGTGHPCRAGDPAGPPGHARPDPLWRGRRNARPLCQPA
ncbi:hypothetical protein RAA17_14875 [Komagataeibacter rhaeticus]|nr:hypothetical protein [Komagataeibacter rhaeticus]